MESEPKTVITQTSRGSHSGVHSGFQSAAQTWGPTSSGSSPRYLSALLFLLSAGLWLLVSNLYHVVEWVAKLPTDDKFNVVVAFALASTVYAVCVREALRDPLVQWSARMAGMAGIVSLVVYSRSVTERVEVLEQQAVARSAGVPAGQISITTATKDKVTVITPGGTTLVMETDNGMRNGTGRSRSAVRATGLGSSGILPGFSGFTIPHAGVNKRSPGTAVLHDWPRPAANWLATAAAGCSE